MKTTKKDYEYFKERVAHWQRELGCVDWTIHFRHSRLENELANTGWVDSDGVATITLATNWADITATESQLDKTAMHEVCHLLFSALTSEAKARYASEYDIDRAEHHIIRVLENVLTGTKR